MYPFRSQSPLREMRLSGSRLAFNGFLHFRIIALVSVFGGLGTFGRWLQSACLRKSGDFTCWKVHIQKTIVHGGHGFMNYQEEKEDIEKVYLFLERGQTGVLSGHIWGSIWLSLV
jgi:hypothetical protein